MVHRDHWGVDGGRIHYDTENNVRREKTNSTLRKKTTLDIAGENKKGAFKKLMPIPPRQQALRI